MIKGRLALVVGRSASLLRDGPLGARLATGGAAAFAVFIFGHGLAFVTQLLIARTFGAESFGIYAYVLAWMVVLSYFAMFGFNTALLRFIPTYTAQQDWPHLAGVIAYAERKVFTVALALIAAGAAVVLLSGGAMTRELRLTFLVGLPIVLLLPLLTLRSAAVRGFGGVVSALAPERVVREPVVTICVFAVLLFGVQQAGAPLVMSAMVAGTVLGLAFATYWMRRLQPAQLFSAAPKIDAGTWRKAALPLLVVTAVEALFDKTGVLVLGLGDMHREAGIYALIFSMAMLVVLPRTAIDTMFAPTIARMHAEGRLADVQNLVGRAALLSLLAGGGIVLVLSVAAGPILSLFGPEFRAGEVPLRILLLGQLLAASAGSQLLLMAMTGNETGAARMLVISAIFHGLLCAGLVIPLGLTGAAIATAAALVVWNALMAVDIWRKLQILPGALGLLRPVPA
ncbi:lipopolysaccharide biosynthesis protein [Dichotomicrobium thermohalophilum]|uniref:O-antigen/teichoic acid export membrane protein n=1 Tax=Dichotomicrobium thermohalophilum TaxID=933063 RepID=A0A397Q1J9_9HYPH|nr:oligosaccharide flippase family protein [Dichotomicrobium thermohalophilum]RIA55380.1 O-antigen/teichoic acid export membrane protein [Dichotomicrobium thermohalophilum]